MRAQRTALLRITHGSPLHREGKNSHRPCGAPLGGTNVMCRLRYFARGARAPLRVGRASFLPTMAKNSFRGARTPHCGGAHNAPLNPAPAPHICAYLRSSRQGAFCGHSAMPNAALFTPVAPLHENLFCKNIFVIATAHFSESEPPRAILLRKQRRRGKPRTKHSDCGVFLPLTEFLFVSSKRNS